MTATSLLRSLLRARPLSAPLLATILMLSGPGPRAADDPNNGGTFDTPGYSTQNGNANRLVNGNGANGSNGADYNGNGDTSGNGQQPSVRNAQDGSRTGNPRSLDRQQQQYLQQQQQQQPQQTPLRRFDGPPQKPSEFQRFVESATGRLLPVFGTRFFADTQDGFSPVDNVPVPSDYLVSPGDEVLVRAWGSIDVDYRSIVDRNGLLNLPKIGSFNVAGVKASELEKQLRAQISRLYTNFNLNVTLGALRSVKVFVVGPARRPGVYTLSSQSTLLSAVVAAGGPGPNGSMRKLSVRRDGKVISELDVYDFLVRGDKSRDVQLASGDVVVFESVGPRIAITGAIDNAAIYELKSTEEPLRDVLRYAGGAPVLANPNQAQLERIDPSQAKAARYVEQFKLDAAGLEKSLRDGDLLTLLQISPQFGNAVTLKGHVAQPLRYPFTPGMRISDLIPDRDALISADFYRRKNLLVQMLDDDSGNRAYRRDDNLNSGAIDPNDRGGYNNDTNANAGGNGNVGNSNGAYGSAARNGNVNATQNRGMDRTARDRGDDDSSQPNRPRRSPTPLFDDLNWDYAVIERLNLNDLTTQVIPFNLADAVLRHEASQNVELKPGDVVTVYSQKDIKGPVSRQTQLVSVEGEVGAPGVYQLLPGETLRGLLQRAGGFTPQAYVYGLEFTREEARKRQRENLLTAISRLETLSATQAARDAANRRDDPAGALTSNAVSTAATQAQLSRLSRLQPNGRIALELNANDRTLAQLPDFPLENADHIVVPSRPGFVTVAGAVLNGNAFLWKPGRTVGDYLKIAGIDEAAEVDNTFVLRADGTIATTGERRSVFGSGTVLTATLEAGDAVIVPNQLDFETWGRAFVRNLKDWSQIFSQFGLGIAAIHSLNN